MSGVVNDIDIGAGSTPRPVKSDAVSSMARQNSDVFLELCYTGDKPEDGPATCYTLRRNNASIMKICFLFNSFQARQYFVA